MADLVYFREVSICSATRKGGISQIRESLRGGECREHVYILRYCFTFAL